MQSQEECVSIAGCDPNSQIWGGGGSWGHRVMPRVSPAAGASNQGGHLTTASISLPDPRRALSEFLQSRVTLDGVHLLLNCTSAINAHFPSAVTLHTSCQGPQAVSGEPPAAHAHGHCPGLPARVSLSWVNHADLVFRLQTGPGVASRAAQLVWHLKCPFCVQVLTSAAEPLRLPARPEGHRQD